MAKSIKYPLPWFLIGLLIIVSLGISIIGYLHLEREKSSLLENKKAELSTIVDLKTSQLVNWREERLGDAKTITGNPLILHHLIYALQNRATQSELSQILEWFNVLHESFSYSNVYLVSRTGIPVLALYDPGPEIDQLTRGVLNLMITRGEIYLTDLHFDVLGKIHIDLILPVWDEYLGIVGFVIAVIDPDDFLYPFIQSQPIPSRTGETILFRQDGDSLRFLSEVRHRPGHLLGMSIPLSDTDSPAVKGLLGERDDIEGIDYRGVPVFAAIREIQGSSWFLLIKIDADEVLQPVADRRLSATIQFGSLLLALNLIVIFYVRYKQAEFTRRQYETDLERKALQRHYDLLAKYANDIILLLDAQGRIIEANDRAVATYGYSHKELLKLNIRDLRSPETRMDADKLLGSVTAENGYLYETEHINKNGKAFPVEISARHIRIDRKEYIQEIIRDISDRKVMESDLHRREEEFRALAENDPDFIIRFDRDYRYVYVNPSIFSITGNTRDYYIGKTLDESDLPGDITSVLKDAVKNVFDTRQKITIEFGFTRDGSHKYVQALFTPELDMDGSPHSVLMVGRDITQLKKTEKRLRRMNRLYAVTNQVNQVIVRRNNRDELLNEVCGIAVEYGDFIMAWIGLVDDESPFLKPKTFAGTENGYLSEVTFLKEGKNESQSGIYSEILKNNYYICNDIALDPLMETHRQAALDRGYRSWAAFVLKEKDQLIGWFAVYSGIENYFDEDEIRLLQEMAFDIGYALDRIRAEEALEKTEALLYASIENLPDALGIFSTIRGGDGNIIDIVIDYLNLAGYQMLQLPGHNLVGLKLSAFFDDFRNDKRFIQFIREIDSGKDVRWEAEPIEITINGNPLSLVIDLRAVKHRNGFVVIWREVSNLKKTEKRLHLQGAALEAAANAIVITDTGGIIQWVNAAFMELTGYGRDEVVGRKANILKSGRHGDEFYYDMWTTISAGKVWQGELFNKRKDGSIYTEEMTITPVLDDTGAIINYIAIKQDVSKQKELQRQMFQIQKLESIGTLASGIAHDFNNLLGIILGYASVLHKAKSDDARFARSVDAISRAVTRGADLVQQILTFARKSEVQMQPVDVNSLIGELNKMLGETLPRTIELRTELTIPLPFLMIDHNQLHQSLLNLCVNARDAILDPDSPDPGRGIITLHTQTANGSDLKVRFHEAKSLQYIHIAVSDTGMGIPEHLKLRIFDPFFSTKGSGKGSGLGLAVVYGVVNANGGFIDVESRLGQGTTFHLYLPVTDIGVTERRSPYEEMADIPGGTETILFVEDESLMLEVTRIVLEEKGYRVLVAHDGEDGIDVFNRHRDEIDLLLTDLGLPKMNGFDMYKRIKEQKPSIKAILASGYLEPERRTLMKKEGILYIVGKPYEPNEILKLIDKTLHDS
jgi:two-component system, cell cycle sensor histidine kinase and response regulator CckA